MINTEHSDIIGEVAYGEERNKIDKTNQLFVYFLVDISLFWLIYHYRFITTSS